MVGITDLNPIEVAIEGGNIPQQKRPYLGMSGIGHECRNYLWLGFRWAYSDYITPRIKRLFERGDMEEPRIIKDLTAIGAKVYMIKDGKEILATGIRDEYQEEIIHFTGHAKGHIDGRIINLPGCEKTEHLGEYKTMNDNYFKQLKKTNVKQAHPVYYAQCQTYMGYLELTRALFVSTNKNTEERVYERIHFDPMFFSNIKSKILDIISSDVPMEKISTRIDYYECNMCRAKEVCFKLKAPDRNCRTCKSGILVDDGGWNCEHTSEYTLIPLDVQRKGCHLYKRLF